MKKPAPSPSGLVDVVSVPILGTTRVARLVRKPVFEGKKVNALCNLDSVELKACL